MRMLNPVDIDQLITIGGMVIRTSSLIPEMREGGSSITPNILTHFHPPLLLPSFLPAFFRCYVCQNTKTVEIDRGRIAEPAVCPSCQTLHSMALIHNRSLFTDKQMVKLQESPGQLCTLLVREIIVFYAYLLAIIFSLQMTCPQARRPTL